MFDDEDELFDAQFNAELERFQEMLKNEDSYYFDPEILEQIIDHFIIKSQLKEAMTAVDFAKNQHPSLMIYDLRKAQIYSTTGKLKESLLILQHLEKMDPNNTELFITKASVFSQLRDHEKAIKYYEKALEVAEHNESPEELEDIRFDLAMEFENIHDYHSAIKVLDKILTYSENNEAAIYEIAYCYERIGDFDKCIEFYNKYINNNPYSFTAWYNLGNIYFLKNNIEKALWAYDFAIVINEEFTSAHFNMGNVYMQTQDYEKALEAYKICIEIDGDDALTLSYLAEAFERLERYDEAIEYYNKSKEINPELSEPWLGIGIILELKGKTAESIIFLMQAVDLQPENANYRLVLGEALFKSERYLDAETELEKALKLEPNYTDAIILISRIKEEYNLQDALDYLFRYDNINELDPKVRLYLSALLWKLGQKTESLLIFKKEYLIDSNSVKTLLLYLPDADKIEEFIQIIESKND